MSEKDERNSMEHFIMLVLKQFLSKHLACNLNIVDNIIVEYIVSVIEDIGVTFDVIDFLEMMNAYIPGFDGINDGLVTEWLFDVAAKIQDGTWSCDVIRLEREVEELEEESLLRKDKNNNARLSPEVPLDETKVEAEKKDCKLQDGGMIKFDLSQMPGEDWFTAPCVASNNLFPVHNKKDVFADGDIVFASPRKLSVPDFTDCQPEVPCDKSQGLLPTPTHNKNKGLLPTPTTPIFASATPKKEESKPVFRYSDKIRQLKEMFPLIPENQLKRCLSKAKSNVEKAVSSILANQNESLVVSSKLKKKEDLGKNGGVVEDHEQDIRKLMDMFPKLLESRIRDRYNIAGNSCERTMRLIISEEQKRDKPSNTESKFKVHEVSFKKKDLSTNEENILKKEISKKYSYYVDDPGKEHHPVLLVKNDKSTKKIQNILDVEKTSDDWVMCSKGNEDKSETVASTKQSCNPKLNRKQRYR